MSVFRSGIVMFCLDFILLFCFCFLKVMKLIGISLDMKLFMITTAKKHDDFDDGDDDNIISSN